MLVVHIEIPGFPAGLHSVPQVLGDDGRMTAFYDLNMVWLIIDDFLGQSAPMPVLMVDVLFQRIFPIYTGLSRIKRMVLRLNRLPRRP